MQTDATNSPESTIESTDPVRSESGDGPESSAEVVFLGTGTSVGVPSIGCECDVCQSDDRRNNRTRCSIVFRLPQGNLLVDTPPELRIQLLREKIPLIHAVLFTHEHADHLYGLDDVRLFPFRLGHAVPLYCESGVEARIRKSYDYAFTTHEPTHPGATPQLTFETISRDPFDVLGVTVTPIPLKHGPRFDVLGFRVGNFAYCTDTNSIPESSMRRLQGLDTLVLDALRYRKHPTHFSVGEALEMIERLQPRKAFLTHICHELDHGPVDAALPDNVHLAYDGLRVPILL
ncbi:MAG: MBL fold metallo-hydrolase [Planctomycetota bacterium]